MGGSSPASTDGPTSTPGTPVGERFDGIELRTSAWRVEPVCVQSARSSYFEDEGSFPAGSVTLDGL